MFYLFQKKNGKKELEILKYADNGLLTIPTKNEKDNTMAIQFVFAQIKTEPTRMEWSLILTSLRLFIFHKNLIFLNSRLNYYPHHLYQAQKNHKPLNQEKKIGQ